ncbi:zinc ribbon domain-containing protein [Halorubrum ezzemoulense]|nr:zinc ribbon domain-containing protein [Halorubrum ezzemoulense]
MADSPLESLAEKAKELDADISDRDLATLQTEISQGSSESPILALETFELIIRSHLESLHSAGVLDDCVEATLTHLSDTDPDVRLTSAEALTGLGRKTNSTFSTSESQGVNWNDEPLNRDTATAVLTGLCHRLTVESHDEIRGRLVVGIGEFGKCDNQMATDAAARLGEFIDSSGSDDDSYHALAQLENICTSFPQVAVDPDVLTVLTPLPSDTISGPETGTTNNNLVETLEILGHAADTGPDVVVGELPRVTTYLSDGSWYEREAAARVCEQLSTVRSIELTPFVPRFADALTDDSRLVRTRSARTLHKIAEAGSDAVEPAVPALEALRDGDVPDPRPPPMTRVRRQFPDDAAVIAEEALAAIEQSETKLYDPPDSTAFGTITRCPNCANKPTDGATFCSKCGTELIVECRQCGAEVSVTSNYCSQCGTPCEQ